MVDIEKVTAKDFPVISEKSPMDGINGLNSQNNFQRSLKKGEGPAEKKDSQKKKESDDIVKKTLSEEEILKMVEEINQGPIFQKQQLFIKWDQEHSLGHLAFKNRDQIIKSFSLNALFHLWKELHYGDPNHYPVGGLLNIED